MRELQKVFTAIVSKDFMPDETRSGRFAAEKRIKLGSIRTVVDREEDSDSCAVASSAKDSSDDEQDPDDCEAISAFSRAPPSSKAPVLPGPVFRHKFSGLLHIRRDPNISSFLCGKAFNGNYDRKNPQSIMELPRCATCFINVD
jgi:hypothetical protein